MGVVAMDHVLRARRIRHLNHATLLARVVREIGPEQFLHVCGSGRNGCEHQECRQINVEVQVGFPHTLFLSASESGRAIAESTTLDTQSECLRECRGSASQLAPAGEISGYTSGRSVRLLSVSGGAIRRDRYDRGA